MKHFLLTVFSIIISLSVTAQSIDMDDIKAKTTSNTSKFYYPTLLAKFMSNDTSMTPEDYRYFYYGTLFTEDFNPYRPNPYEKEIKALDQVYLKREHLTRAEKKEVERIARLSLANNPLDLRQMMYMTYVYESNRKYNLAKIWRNKLSNILLTISRSGTGTDPEHARIVVYPRHEFDLYNLSAKPVLVEKQEFVPPYYEKITVKQAGKDTDFYFNLKPLLDQYYLKHPEELDKTD